MGQLILDLFQAICQNLTVNERLGIWNTGAWAFKKFKIYIQGMKRRWLLAGRQDSEETWSAILHDWQIDQVKGEPKIVRLSLRINYRKRNQGIPLVNVNKRSCLARLDKKHFPFLHNWRKNVLISFLLQRPRKYILQPIQIVLWNKKYD